MNFLPSTRALIFPAQHVLRQLSRSKATISYPGGQRAKWWQGKSASSPTVAVLRMSGVIAEARGGRYVNITSVRPVLELVMQMKKIDAIALEINSPGGSPSQSDLIRNEVRRVAVEKKVPVLSFVEDSAASGGYYIACAGDEIIANAHSIVGSIGAISASFGLKQVIDRWNIERRVFVAGKNKLLNDPFSELGDSNRSKIQYLIDSIHKTFVDTVKESRGDRLKETLDKPLFEGDIFTSQDAVNVGLVDSIAPSMETYLVDRFGKNVKLVRYAQKRGFRDLFNTHAAVDELFSSSSGSFDAASFLQRLFIQEALSNERNSPKISG